MVKIGLVLMPMWNVDGPPLGLAYISQSLRNKGHETYVYDLNLDLSLQFEKLEMGAPNIWAGSFALDWRDTIKYYSQIRPLISNVMDEAKEILLKKLIKNEISYLGFSVYETNKLPSVEMAAFIKKNIPEVKIIFGGPGASNGSCQDSILQGDVDYLVLGEGEKIVIDLVDALITGQGISKLNGITYLNREGEIITTENTALIDVNNLPILDFKDFNIESYRHKFIPFMMSRGCVAKCTFCDETNYWQKYRFRSAKHIFDEVNYNANFFGVHDFRAMDSLINGNHKVLEEFADLLIEHKMKITFNGNARVSKSLNLKLLQKLKKSGLNFLIFGIESGSNKILKLMNKQISIDTAKQNLEDCFKAGVDAHINLIIGFPGEEEEDFLETLSFLNSISSFISRVNIGFGLGIGPGQELFDKASEFNILTDQAGNVIYHAELGWQTADGRNNAIIRKDRIMRVKKKLDELKIPHD